MSESDRRIGDNFPPSPIEEGGMPVEVDRDALLLGIDPANLVVVETVDLSRLLELQFAALLERNREFMVGLQRWRDEHRNGRIADDAELNKLSDWMVQLRDYAGPDGEVDEARKKVVGPLYAAWKAANAWFANLTQPVMDAIGPARNAQVGTLQYAQTAFLVDKARKEAAERQRLADEAAAEARRKAEEARRLAEQDAPQEAVEAVTEAALEAEVRAVEIATAAAAPPREMVRSHSGLGTTTTLRSEWDFELVDIKALCRAVADGKQPSTFVTVVPQAIRQAVRAKHAPLRECMGLRIFETHAASRRGV